MFFEIAGMIILIFTLGLLTGLASSSIWIAINNEIKDFDSILKMFFQYFLASILMVMVTYMLIAAEAAPWAIIIVYATHVLVVAYMLTLRIKNNTAKQILVLIGVVAYSVILFVNEHTVVLPTAVIGLIVLGIVTGCYQLVQKVKNKNLGKIEAR